jgi:hypothetical protein
MNSTSTKYLHPRQNIFEIVNDNGQTNRMRNTELDDLGNKVVG